MRFNASQARRTCTNPFHDTDRALDRRQAAADQKACNEYDLGARVVVEDEPAGRTHHHDLRQRPRRLRKGLDDVVAVRGGVVRPARVGLAAISRSAPSCMPIARTSSTCFSADVSMEKLREKARAGLRGGPARQPVVPQAEEKQEQRTHGPYAAEQGMHHEEKTQEDRRQGMSKTARWPATERLADVTVWR